MKDLEKSTIDNEVLVAVKMIDMSETFMKADGIFEMDRESKTMKLLDSKYIINLEKYFLLNKTVVLVMEYAEGGELK